MAVHWWNGNPLGALLCDDINVLLGYICIIQGVPLNMQQFVSSNLSFSLLKSEVKSSLPCHVHAVRGNELLLLKVWWNLKTNSDKDSNWNLKLISCHLIWCISDSSRYSLEFFGFHGFRLEVYTNLETTFWVLWDTLYDLHGILMVDA